MSITKKHLLLDFELELDFSLIGISSPLRDYRLSHFIFKHTGLELVRGKENYIDHKGYLKDKDKDEMDYHIVFERTKQKKHQSITTPFTGAVMKILNLSII